MVVGKESFAVSRGRYLPDGDTLGPSLNEPTGIWRFREMTNTSNLESDQSCLLPGLNTLLFDGVGDVASSLI